MRDDSTMSSGRRDAIGPDADGHCPSCGHNEWVTVPDDWTVELPLRDRRGVVPEVFLFGCGHCGFLRMHVDVVAGVDAARVAQLRFASASFAHRIRRVADSEHRRAP
jgi:hypothetical protein